MLREDADILSCCYGQAKHRFVKGAGLRDLEAKSHHSQCGNVNIRGDWRRPSMSHVSYGFRRKDRTLMYPI